MFDLLWRFRILQYLYRHDKMPNQIQRQIRPTEPCKYDEHV